MKKLLIIIIIAVIGVAAWYFSTSQEDGSGHRLTSSGTEDSAGREGAGSSRLDGDGGLVKNADSTEDIEDDYYYEDIRPATELYKNADEALTAVKEGALDYDDLILEQFVDLGPECTWCPEFYASVTDLMFSDSSDLDEKSYYAEILAISGRVETVETLIGAVKNAQDEEMEDLYAEALELTIGGDDVVAYLGKQLDTENVLLHEATVAAITNHGSRLTVDTLYEATVKDGDPDGFYSLGIGLGEVIPEDEAMPYLIELANKRDKYSHLAIKALLNAGDEGLKTVIDLLENFKEPDVQEGLLEDAIDHVSYEDDTEQYLRDVLKTTRSPAVRSFAKEVLEEFDLELEEE